MSDGGKGDKARPFSVDLEKFAENFDLIFGKKKKQETLKDYIEQKENEYNLKSDKRKP